MSWESSAEYYRLANEIVRQKLGGLHSARCLLASVDFAEIERLQVAGEWDGAAELLATEARNLEAGGADVVVLCTNTMHKVADQIQQAIGIPLLHLADTTAAAVLGAGMTRVGLLGTAFTMEQEFYRDRLAGHGLSVLTPPPADRSEVHRIIYDELCLGLFKEDSRVDLPQCDRAAGRRRSAGRDPGLYRDRVADLRTGQLGAGVSDHPDPRRSRRRVVARENRLLQK